MYSRLRASVNAAGKRLGIAFVVAPVLCVVAGRTIPRCSCDATLTALFTPRHAQLGRYEVCTTAEPLASVAPKGWAVEALEPLDAFGTAGAYNRADLARLYGGRRARVARGWVRTGDRFESFALISPYPDAALAHLMPGTMVIRYVVLP